MSAAANTVDAVDPAELDVLGRHWHPVARSDAIDDGPVGVVLLGRPLVVFRSAGQACVATDRCPHRGSPLSMGSYDDDCLVCPYHVLRYAADGRCVAFPSRPDARLPKRLTLETLHTRESHGLVWACAGEPARDDPPDWAFYDRPDVQTVQIGPVRWLASASRVAENFNDIAHFSTIHRVTFGPSDRPVAPQEVVATETGFASDVKVFQQYRNTLDGSVEEIEAAYRYDFTFPFSCELTITYPDGEIECIQLSALPESATSSLVFQQSARTNLGNDPVEPWRDFQAAVNEEDRVICEALQPREVSFRLEGTGEVALPTDAFSIAYRRLWKSLCA
ncbi:MAG: aromatic ring-hydroxylating dioxygenase subunit alpha [Acidimicrobiaceae bacterium]|nr:aromatic ring-hydroxylating dioxygenase subunit alpha [Acidimicrobiaceae bacterium]MYH44205.1 aromatic ring-hydroxylating dioxygenase subunit alpha [Acidimicrobiaceae bacterium]MYJ43307.1 aromatic ring-hydroxylating dioxygenase subunit alpha [Acidimicrobiaceae bacterium]MYK74636.1 aromatic ring-hydroxylating dioxygenase subunit alpha [Acidimicrobiaceae bacterium]